MSTHDRHEAIKEYKRRRGCEVCGRTPDVRKLLLVRPDRSGLTISQLAQMGSVSDERLWEEVRRRKVICRSCSRWSG